MAILNISLSDRRRETFLHLGALLLVFSLLFVIRGAWQPGQFSADEPVYIELAIKAWQSHAGTHIAFSPLYHDLITPFVAIFFEKETGFIVWKFLLFYTSSVLLYLLVAKLSRPWVGLLAAIHFNLMITPIMLSGTYMMLAIAWILLAMLVLAIRPSLVGVAACLMLTGIHIRGEFSLILLAFLLLCAVFAPKALFSRRFFAQIIPGILVFVGIIYWHGSTLPEFKNDLSLRGGYAYHHYIGKTMTEEGLLLKYTDKKWGQLEMAELDKAYRDQFGKTLTEFRKQGGFNLPEMYAANPDLIGRHYRKVFASASVNFLEAFMVEIAMPTNPYSLRQTLSDHRLFYAAQVVIHLGFLAMVALPGAIPRYRKHLEPAPCAPVSRVLVLACLSPLAAIPSWFLSMPQPFYIILLLPSVYLMLVLFARRFAPQMTGCNLQPSELG